MIKAVFFDLDQTLINRTATFADYLTLMYQDLNVVDSNVSTERFYQEVHRWDDNGYRDKQETFALVIKNLSLPLSVMDLFTHFTANYGQDAVLFSGVKTYLQELHKKYPLALITNGRTDGQEKKLNVTDIYHLFQVVLISEAEGIKKPEPDIYMRACNRMGVEPKEVLFVGDHPKNDVEVPKSLGMKAIWVKNDTYQQPAVYDGIVESVLELDGYF